MRRLGIILCLTLPLLAQKDPVSRSWNQPVEPFRIAGNLYYVGASDITSYLITTPKGHILLDGGFEETAPMILANIGKLGFDPKDVKVLLSSHAHYDHAAGLAELKRVTGATFYATAEDLPQHARGGLDDPHFGNRFPYPPVVADRIIKDRGTISLGGTTLTAHLTPGHTRGCTTWTTRIQGLDVVFVGSPTTPFDRVLGNPAYPDLVSDYRRQFERLKSLNVDVFLASHGNFFDLEKKRTALGDRKQTGNPFVDREGYHRFVTAAETRFEDRVRNEGAQASR